MSGLKAEVDIAFAKKEFQVEDSQVKLTIGQNWNNMIKQINLFEYECLTVQKSNKFNESFNREITEKISLIEFKLAAESIEDYENIQQLINETKFMIEKKVKIKIFFHYRLIYFQLFYYLGNCL